jgi:hypothetical protein
VSPFAATQASPGRRASSENLAARIDQAAARGELGLGEIVEALRDDSAPRFAPLTAPSAAAIMTCMGTLMAEVPPMTASPDALALANFELLHRSRLVDDEGRERGSMIADLRASAFLAAAILAEPRELGEQQVAGHSLSDDTLLAMSEICNNLAAVLNGVAGNDQIRAKPMEPFDAQESLAARARLDFSIEGGCLVIALY